jgi:hypothetical protein
MKRMLLIALVAIAMLSLFSAGCSNEKVVNTVDQQIFNVAPENIPQISTQEANQQDTTGLPVICSIDWGSAREYQGNWTEWVISEARYTLCRNRSGSSSVSLGGMSMSDWNWAGDDSWAYNQVVLYQGSPGTTGMVQVRNTQPPNSFIERGGWCKFFANLVLFRSSYGIGEGYHLVLPSGYNYATQDIHNAQRGWVIQRGGSSPHTAIVAENLGWGLDLIDANWIGGNGNFYIARHPMNWSQLSGFHAYFPTRMLRFY